jgi:hypothetical protein
MVWFLVSIFGGLAFHGRFGSFWLHLLAFAALGFPFACWVFRRESRRELEKTMRRTICPKCDTSAEAHAGTACQCGGTFVPQSKMKWVDES